MYSTRNNVISWRNMDLFSKRSRFFVYA